MAATSTVLQTLAPGDHLVLSADVYGGTYRVAARLFQGWGLRLSVVDMTSLDQLKQAIRSETRLVWVETPTNPLLGVVDIAGAAEAAHAAGALCAVDNTFATRSCSGLWSSGPTWSSTPRPSTWAGTPTWSAGPW